MIGLVDFLVASGLPVETGKRKLKIHLACWNGREHPIDVYYAGDFKSWQEWQTRHNFFCPHVLSLIDLGQSAWLFAGVFEVLGHKPHPKRAEHTLYSTRQLPGQEDMIGRILVHHKRTRASYIWYKPTIALPIVEIRREKMSIGDFPGYNAVTVSHSQLSIITGQEIASWQGALANVKGVYLITDTSTGDHYVGKASGEEGIWQRWCGYAKNGHGGNKELKRLIKEKGFEHTKNFQYSVLEIADSHASEQDILERESYWMKVLKTREFGLN